MFAFELSVVLALGGIAAMASLIQTARVVLPQVAAIRQALDECPQQREVRFAVIETIVGYNDGKVIPFKPRRAVNLALRPGVRAVA